MEEEEAAAGKMKQFHGAGGGSGGSSSAGLDLERCRFPYCVVWTPIPVLTWLFPIVGHMGICTSAGVIQDFAGPYYVSVSEGLFPTIRCSIFNRGCVFGQELEGNSSTAH
ncbi:hypothetical protein lerEdw1_002882 [Lerista edwardsae]|nr:hypothetical protein lerEdw1_002885 [Lerista edwardsae]KAJ6650837.1 hypothetical protein lerEdw1_002882 [Lerista edwardsae]